MRSSRGMILLTSLLFATAIVAMPDYRRSEFLSHASATNSPPVANDDNYTRHGSGAIGSLLQNDFDPDGNPMQIDIITFPTQGQLSGLATRGFYDYRLNNPSFTGTDTFTYQACDNSNACSATATVTIQIVNQAPVANPDSYTVHGTTNIGPMRVNDSDPDGDAISWDYVSAPSHGTMFGLPNPYPPDVKSYVPTYGYTGPDSFTYKVCDEFGICSSPATVTLSVVNNPPAPGYDSYLVNGSTIIGPLLANDSDPEGDEFNNDPTILVSPSHGALQGLPYPAYPHDVKRYVPDEGFAGTDTFQYEITDSLGASGTTTVALHVLEGDDAENAGATSCNARLGEPVNVTNGNMYLQQTDYHLPGVGPALNVARTYNSKLQTMGIFGRGWSSAYDESIKVYGATFIRLNLPDGRAVHFARPDSSGAFAPVEKDFHGQPSQNGDGSFTLSFPEGTIHQFDASGRLLSLADRYNSQATLAYDAAGKLVSLTDPFGRVLSFTTNAGGQVVSISDTLGTIANYVYGGMNQLLSVTYSDNSAFQFSYDADFRLTSVSDALGNLVEAHTYDSQGRALTSQKHGGVELYTFDYVGDTQTDVTDALGHTTSFTIDKSKGRNVVTRVEGFCDCGGGSSQVQTWDYDSQLNLTAATNALNHTFTYTYDANGNPLTETDTTGTITFTYNEFGEVLTETDQLNGVTTNTYDAQGNPLTTTNALGKTTSFSYDARGLLLTVTDARGKVTSFAYDSSGNIITKTDALGHAAQFAYDARSRLTAATNALGHTTSLAYDGVGRPAQVIQADGSIISYEYDLGGRRTAMVDAKGNRNTFAYDGANRLTSETDALNQTTGYSYDLMSNLTARTDALGRVTNYEYDDFNRLAKTTYPPAVAGAARLFETLAYDAAGNVIQRTDTAGRTTFYGYTNESRLDHVQDAADQLTLFNYDALGRMTALIDAKNQRHRFNYDAVGQLKHVRRGVTVMSFTYDAVGNRKQRTDYNGALTTYDYDALNRLKTITYPDTSSVSYAYDKLSRLQTATNENGTVNFDYNKMNRVTKVTDVFGQVIDYNYDPNGNRTKLMLNAATIATYRYDAGDRLTKILDAASLATNYTYDVTNKLSSRKLPNGILSSYQYDGLDRVTRLLDARGAATVADHQYQYSTASQITQITEPTNTKSYGYDAVERLTSAAYTNPIQSNENYAYDGVGNRTSSHLSATYSHQPFNRLVSTASATYSYDTNGNLISKTDANGTTQYSWDFENRVKLVTLPSGSTVNYKYDALGRRIQRTPSSGVSTNFIYDGPDVVKDLNSDGSAVDYLNGPGIDNKLRLTDSRLGATGPLYFLQDQLGSTTALTTSLGVSVSQFTYDAFGNSSGSSLTRYDYTGRERDPDTGLLYYRTRWYDPQVGRFISEDPINFRGGVNWYAYVGNNPVLFRDPSGLCPEKKKCRQDKTGGDRGDVEDLLGRAGLLNQISEIRSAGPKNPEGIILIIGNRQAFVDALNADPRFRHRTLFGAEHASQVGASVTSVLDYRSFTTVRDTLGIDSHGFRRSLQVDVGDEIRGGAALGYADLDCDNPAQDVVGGLKHGGPIILRRLGGWLGSLFGR